MAPWVSAPQESSGTSCSSPRASSLRRRMKPTLGPVDVSEDQAVALAQQPRGAGPSLRPRGTGRRRSCAARWRRLSLPAMFAVVVFVVSVRELHDTIKEHIFVAARRRLPNPWLF